MWKRGVEQRLRRAGPWLVLALSAIPAIWYVVDIPRDLDPEFPQVVRPTFSAYPPFSYRLAEPGDTIDHVAVYVASAAVVLSAWGWWRQHEKRPWMAAMAISIAAFWHAATPGPLMDGWHGLGWRILFEPTAPLWLRLSIAGLAATLAAVGVWGLWGCSPRTWWLTARENGTLGLFLTAAILVGARQLSWLDREPIGYWPRWMYVWGLMAWSLGLLQLAPAARAGWWRRAALPTMVLAWLVLDITGRGLFWYQRPLRRLREVVAGRIYISAMPTYQGLVLAQERHHFRTIINLFPEYTSQQSPDLPEELRFAGERGIQYVGNPPGEPTGEEFIARTIALARDPSAWPILFHCHASMDRSPAWMGIYRFVVQGWPLADALREIERHRGLRPAASVTLLYNRVLPRLAPERWALDPTAAVLRESAAGTKRHAMRTADRRPGRSVPGKTPTSDSDRSRN